MAFDTVFVPFLRSLRTSRPWRESHARDAKSAEEGGAEEEVPSDRSILLSETFMPLACGRADHDGFRWNGRNM